MDNEIWKDIAGYKGKYQISNLGRVKVTSNDRTRKERILKPYIPKDKKYYVIALSDGHNNQKQFKIHRLVFNTFYPIDNMEKYVVHHINRNTKDNNLSNLQRLTAKEHNYLHKDDNRKS